MTPVFYFRGTLTQYWNLVHAEWIRFGGNAHANPLAISPHRPPMEFEEVVLEFLDDYFRRGPKPEPVPIPGLTLPKKSTFVFPPEIIHVPVIVRAESISNGTLVSLTVRIEKEAHEEFGKSALVKWNEIKSAWESKGWLIDSLIQTPRPTVKPVKPAKPKSGDHLNLWFDWHDKMHADGFKCTLKEIAEETGYSYGHIRILSANFNKERGIQKT